MVFSLFWVNCIFFVRRGTNQIHFLETCFTFSPQSCTILPGFFAFSPQFGILLDLYVIFCQVCKFSHEIALLLTTWYVLLTSVCSFSQNIQISQTPVFNLNNKHEIHLCLRRICKQFLEYKMNKILKYYFVSFFNLILTTKRARRERCCEI